MSYIEISNLSKSYGKIKALNNVNINVDAGELFGLIGPDGAGKSTLIRIVTTLLLPDSGYVNVLGYNTREDYKKIRGEIGYMPAVFSLYSDLTVQENLDFFAGVFGATVAENYNLIRGVYHMLEPFKNRPAGKLSGGMKQKLALSCALIHRPKVLILDEPTTGVDAVSRRELWELLYDIKHQGITIFVSTAYMDEAKQCDRVALIQKGRVLGVNSPHGFAQMFPHKLYDVYADGIWSFLDKIRALDTCKSAYMFGSNLHYVSTDDAETTETLTNKLHQIGLSGDVDIKQINAGIEDYFIRQLTENAELS